MKVQVLSKEMDSLRERVIGLEEQLRKRSEADTAVQETHNNTIHHILTKLKELQDNMTAKGGSKAAQPTSTTSSSPVDFIKIVTTEGSDLVEFPADAADGNLTLKSVAIVYPGVSGLKYKTTNNTTRLCR